MFNVPLGDPVFGAPVLPAADVIDDLFFVDFCFLPSTKPGVLPGSSTGLRAAGASRGGGGGAATGGSGTGLGTSGLGVDPPPIHISCSPIFFVEANQQLNVDRHGT